MRCRFEKVLLQVEYQLFGGEGLVGEPRRAGVLAPAALGAGVSVHQVFPAKVADGGHAERLLVLDPLLDVGDRLHSAFGGEVVEEDVEWRYENVQVLRVDDIDEEPEDDTKVCEKG